MNQVNRITCLLMIPLGIVAAAALDGAAGGVAGALIAAAGPVLCPPLTDKEIRAKRERLEQAAKTEINKLGSRYACHKSNYSKRGE